MQIQNLDVWFLSHQLWEGNLRPPREEWWIDLLTEICSQTWCEVGRQLDQERDKWWYPPNCRLSTPWLVAAPPWMGKTLHPPPGARWLPHQDHPWEFVMIMIFILNKIHHDYQQQKVSLQEMSSRISVLESQNQSHLQVLRLFLLLVHVPRSHFLGALW